MFYLARPNKCQQVALYFAPADYLDVTNRFAASFVQQKTGTRSPVAATPQHPQPPCSERPTDGDEDLFAFLWRELQLARRLQPAPAPSIRPFFNRVIPGPMAHARSMKVILFLWGGQFWRQPPFEGGLLEAVSTRFFTKDRQPNRDRNGAGR
jgi:hypothetical protein